MATQTPGEIWDTLVESALRQASTPKSPPSTRAKLQLLDKPECKILPAVQRSIAEIDKTVRDTIRSLVDGEAPWPLFLHGPAGTGKTCAGLCLVDHTPGSMYWTLSKLCSHLIEVQHDRVTNSAGYHVTIEKFWNSVSAAKVVVLDEIGCRDRVSDHVYEAAKTVLDVRHGKPLVCVSNLELEKLEALFDDRIASRLCEGTVMKLGGKDRRLK